MLSGETDFLLKVVAGTDTLDRFLTTKLTPAPNVNHVKTALAFRTRKSLPACRLTKTMVRNRSRGEVSTMSEPDRRLGRVRTPNGSGNRNRQNLVALRAAGVDLGTIPDTLADKRARS